MDFLEKALALEKQSRNYKNIADIFLNICVVLSSLKKHKDALDAALNAIFLIQEELIDHMLPGLFGGSGPEHAQGLLSTQRPRQTDPSKNLNSEKRDMFLKSSVKVDKTISTQAKNGPSTLGPSGLNSDFVVDRIKVLVIAYHNMGAELEHLNLYDDALRVYEKGLKLSYGYLDKEEAITKELEAIIEMLGSRMHTKKRPSSLQQYKISTAAVKPAKYLWPGSQKENLSITISQNEIQEDIVPGYNTERPTAPSRQKITSSSVIDCTEPVSDYRQEHSVQYEEKQTKTKKSLSSIVGSINGMNPKSTLKSKPLNNEYSFSGGHTGSVISRNVVSFKTNALLASEAGTKTVFFPATQVRESKDTVIDLNSKDFNYRKSQTVPLNEALLKLQKFHETSQNIPKITQREHGRSHCQEKADLQPSFVDQDSNFWSKSSSKNSFIENQKSKRTLNNSYTSNREHMGKTQALLSAPSSFKNLTNRPKKAESNPILNHGPLRILKKPSIHPARYLLAAKQPIPIDERPEESMMTNNITMAQSSCESHVDPEIPNEQDTQSINASKLENSDFQGDLSISKTGNEHENILIKNTTGNGSLSVLSKELMNSPNSSQFNVRINSTANFEQGRYRSKNLIDLVPIASNEVNDE